MAYDLKIYASLRTCQHTRLLLIVNFYSDSVFLRLSHHLGPNILKVKVVIDLMVGDVGLWPAKTFVWTRVTQDLRNGGPLEMLSIAKQVQIKVLLHYFSLLLFNLRNTFLFTVFLPDRGIAGIREMPHYNSAKRENKKKAKKATTKKTLWELSSRHAFYL